jgi:hypothetical protein
MACGSCDTCNIFTNHIINKYLSKYTPISLRLNLREVPQKRKCVLTQQHPSLFQIALLQ